MILQGHGPEWEQSEKPALEQLIRLGFEYKTRRELDETRESDLEPLLIDQLAKAILRLNPWIDKHGIKETIRQFKKFESNVSIDANEIIHARINGISTRKLEPITVMQEIDGCKNRRTVKIIDFNNIENNTFLVTNQFFLKGYKDDILPDIVLFVNGIPLVVIECKSPYISNPIREAITNNLFRYQKQNTGYESLFYYTQILVATCGIQAKYAPTYAPAHYYKEWVDPYPLTVNDIQQDLKHSRKQEILIGGMFTKKHLLELIRNFIAFQIEEKQKVKKIAKYTQFRAVQKTIQKIDDGKTPLEKGGIIWHTQGSGKSLTMLWLTIKIKRLYNNPTILVITDRVQLDNQILETFKTCNFPNPIQAKRKENLKDMLENNKGATIMSTIFKFPFFKDEIPHSISDEQCFVLVDEGHRTQYGLTSAAMRAALPNAIFFAYTGTPILKNSQTQKTFGTYIDIYKISESEKDGSTLPIYYEGQFNDMHVQNKTIENKFKKFTRNINDEKQEYLKNKYVNKITLASTPDRIKKIAKKITEHYTTNLHPNGLKAMIVTSSKKAAQLYKNALDELNAPKSKIIMTTTPADKKHGLHKYKLTKRDQKIIEEQFKLPIKDNDLCILIVVDMLLTGFDAPILQTLYLDKGLEEHSLLQAIARVNRPYGKIKTHGMIVDFWGISHNLDVAYKIYTNTDVEKILKPLNDAHAKLKAAHNKVISYFPTLDKINLEESIHILKLDDVRESFNYDFREFSKFMDLVLPNPKALKYSKDLTKLARIRAAVRTALFDENLSLIDIGGKIKKLIDESIHTDDPIRIIPPTKLDSKQFFQLVNSYKSIETRASIIERKSRIIIAEEESKNPAYYKSLKLRLEEIIEQLKQKKFQDAQTFNKLHDLISEILLSKEPKNGEFDSSVEFAIFCSLEAVSNKEKSIELTREIFNSLEPLKVIEWTKKENIQKEMRVKIKDLLSDHRFDSEHIGDLAKEIVNLMKVNQS